MGAFLKESDMESLLRPTPPPSPTRPLPVHKGRRIPSTGAPLSSSPESPRSAAISLGHPKIISPAGGGAVGAGPPLAPTPSIDAAVATTAGLVRAKFAERFSASSRTAELETALTSPSPAPEPATAAATATATATAAAPNPAPPGAAPPPPPSWVDRFVSLVGAGAKVATRVGGGGIPPVASAPVLSALDAPTPASSMVPASTTPAPAPAPAGAGTSTDRHVDSTNTDHRTHHHHNLTYTTIPTSTTTAPFVPVLGPLPLTNTSNTTKNAPGPITNTSSVNQLQLHVGVLQISPWHEPFPLLADVDQYDPNTLDIVVDEEERTYWLGLLRTQAKNTASKAADSEGMSEEATKRAEAFQSALETHLTTIIDDPRAYGNLGLADVFEMREECLREFGFRDVYKSDKARENEAAMQVRMMMMMMCND